MVKNMNFRVPQGKGKQKPLLKGKPSKTWVV